MKITMIGTLPPQKGISFYCADLLESLKKKNSIKIEFIGFKKLYPAFLYKGGEKIDDPHSNINISDERILNILTYYNPFSWFWAGISAKGTIIHAQWWSHVLAPIYFVILVVCKLRGKIIIITVHNVLPHEKNMINNLLNKSIFFLSDYFVVHTEDNKQKLLLNNIPDKSIFVIPLGASNKKIISKIEAKNYFKIDQNHKVILFFGNIRNYKGLDTLLEALGTINRNDISLLIGGSLWKNNWDLYESIIKKYNLEKNIIKKLEFIQPSEVGYFFSACDIVVCPYSYFDSQSGVASLALSYKKPLIVTNVGGLPDFVKDSRFIINPNDPLSLRNMILLAIDDNEILRKLEMESAELSEKYSWDNIAERTIEMYKQILDY